MNAAEAGSTARRAVFEPFVPRVVARRSGSAHPRKTTVAAEPPSIDVDDAPADLGEAEIVPAQVASACASAPASAGVATLPGRLDALVRARAIELAGVACARALHAAVARNRLFVARFVDDAIAAAGKSSAKRVRLSPDDAAAIAGRVGADVVADPAVEAGEVVVETPSGSVRATIEERSASLVRAAADE